MTDRPTTEPRTMREALDELAESFPVDDISDAPWVVERGSIAWMIREGENGPQVGNFILEADARWVAAARNAIGAEAAQGAAPPNHVVVERLDRPGNRANLEGPTDEERLAFKRSEREAAAAIMAGDRFCPDPSAHGGAAPRAEGLDPHRLGGLIERAIRDSKRQSGGLLPDGWTLVEMALAYPPETPTEPSQSIPSRPSDERVPEDPDALARSKKHANAYAKWVEWMSPGYVVGVLDRFDALKQQIAELEDKFHELDGTTRILLISRLVQDGHAPDWKAAVKMVREDFEGVKALYKGTEEASK